MVLSINQCNKNDKLNIHINGFYATFVVSITFKWINFDGFQKIDN